MAGNILAYLHPRLRGSGCRAYGSDMCVRVDDSNVWYPDVSMFCGDPGSIERERLPIFDDPTIIFEVLPDSIAPDDQDARLAEYRTLPSLDTIVFVDPVNELTRVVQRLGPTSWRDDMFAQPHDVELPSLGITIPHDEMFARD